MTTKTTTSTKRYDLGEIMRRAHRLAKGLGLAFSEALRLSWKRAKDILPSSLPYSQWATPNAQPTKANAWQTVVTKALALVAPVASLFSRSLVVV